LRRHGQRTFLVSGEKKRLEITRRGGWNRGRGNGGRAQHREMGRRKEGTGLPRGGKKKKRGEKKEGKSVRRGKANTPEKRKIGVYAKREGRESKKKMNRNLEKLDTLCEATLIVGGRIF